MQLFGVLCDENRVDLQRQFLHSLRWQQVSVIDNDKLTQRFKRCKCL